MRPVNYYKGGVCVCGGGFSGGGSRKNIAV